MTPSDSIQPAPINGLAVLSVDDVSKLAESMKTVAMDPVSAAMQIFSNLGNAATVSGDTLRTALAASSVPLVGPLTNLIAAIQGINKLGDLVTVTNSRQVEVTLGGTEVRFKTDVNFQVSNENNLPMLTKIVGVSVHKLFWFDIQSVIVTQHQDQKVVRVTTSGGTRDFPVG